MLYFKSILYVFDVVVPISSGGLLSERYMLNSIGSVSVELQLRVRFVETPKDPSGGYGFEGVEGGISSVVNVQIGPLVFFPLLSSDITCQ